MEARSRAGPRRTLIGMPRTITVCDRANPTSSANASKESWRPDPQRSESARTSASWSRRLAISAGAERIRGGQEIRQHQEVGDVRVPLQPAGTVILDHPDRCTAKPLMGTTFQFARDLSARVDDLFLFDSHSGVLLDRALSWDESPAIVSLRRDTSMAHATKVPSLGPKPATKPYAWLLIGPLRIAYHRLRSIPAGDPSGRC